MLKKVRVKQSTDVNKLLKFALPSQKKEILKLAKELKGKKIAQINATKVGGGVAEILNSLVPYLNALGVKSEWYAIDPDKIPPKFFSFTNKLHDASQGAEIDFKEKDWELYERVNKKIAKSINNLDCDAILINDPQPLFSIKYLSASKPVIYYSHIDTSSAYPKVWERVLPVIKSVDYIVFSNKDFVHKHLPTNKIKIFTPAIDPLSVKQQIVTRKKARNYLAGFGLPSSNRLIVQVSRFDIWKNPLGLIEAFRIAKRTYPKMKLALVGFQEAKDNPAAEIVYRDVAAVAEGDPDIFLFYKPTGVKDISYFTSIAQNAADIIVQNSIKEGFGMTLTEAMWKAKPVIGGPASGIKRQIKNGENGFIIKTSEELSQKITFFVKNPSNARKMGKEAKKTVYDNFLMPRLILDHLKVYKASLDKHRRTWV